MQRYLDLAKDDSKILELRFNNTVLRSNDQPITRTEAQSANQLSFPAGKPLSKYVAVSLDNDAPFPSFNFLSPILHSMQADLKVSSPSSKVLTSNNPPIVNWIGPEPPPGSSPHRYLFLLYEQPDGFSSKDFGFPEGKPVGLWARIRWNLATWEKKAKVGEPVAVAYFQSV
ncbi:hypothetical protein RBB50_003076 [Rhinocladiella similis]